MKSCLTSSNPVVTIRIFSSVTVWLLSDLSNMVNMPYSCFYLSPLTQPNTPSILPISPARLRAARVSVNLLRKKKPVTPWFFYTDFICKVAEGDFFGSTVQSTHSRPQTLCLRDTRRGTRDEVDLNIFSKFVWTGRAKRLWNGAQC